ncbi:MAG: DUF4325 domain-containing protein [Candidatus Melainabacteria bacterium]|nr:DUF4325 domain-containing protein [Candidatus Melainabacteria bacterium]
MARTNKDAELWQSTLKLLQQGERNLTYTLSQESGLSRQQINNYLKRWIEEGRLERQGTSRKPRYILKEIQESYEIDLTLYRDESSIFSITVKDSLKALPANIYNILQFAFTEMVNNVIDHSGGTLLRIGLTITATRIQLYIADNGEGIFHRIQRLLGLSSPQQAILKLSPGKFTTDPTRHTGQGIFYTSRMCDLFFICSRSLIFTHHNSNSNDRLSETNIKQEQGTIVWMELSRSSTLTSKEIFDRYADEKDYSFSKTEFSMRLALQEGELISRSQARQIGAQLVGFRQAILNFKNVDWIGQAFADELFRVFQNEHPSLRLIPLFTNESVSQMIERAILDSTPKDPLA